MKKCSKCGNDRPKSEFYKNKTKSDGLHAQCKECTKISNNNWRKKNPEKAKASRTDWAKKNTEKRRLANYRWQKNNYDVVRSSQLKYKYGITLDRYNEMYTNQNGCCAICGKHQDSFSKTLAVDHCHDTGKVRGLLCSNCNTAIGKLNDDVSLVLKAAAYLTEYLN